MPGTTRTQLPSAIGAALALTLALGSSPTAGAAPIPVLLDFEGFAIGDEFLGTGMSPLLPAGGGFTYILFSTESFGTLNPATGHASIEVTSGGPFGSARSICARPGLSGPVDCTGALNLLFAVAAIDISFGVAADEGPAIDVAVLLDPDDAAVRAFASFLPDGAPLTPTTVSLASLAFNESPDGSGAPVAVAPDTPLYGLVVDSADDPSGLLYDDIRFTLVSEPGSTLLVCAGLAGLVVRARPRDAHDPRR